MKRRISQSLCAAVVSASITCLTAACAPQVPSSGSSTASTVDSTTTSVTSTGSDTTGTTSSTGSTTGSESQMLLFQDDGKGAQLIKDMEAGRTPVSCNVLYDQMGARPDITVTDPATITRIYELVKSINVMGESGMGITDSYHHVIFELQDGTKVGFSFEGEGNLAKGGKNYYVMGDAALWSYVRRLQDGELTDTPGAQHAIYLRESEKGTVISCPTSAATGDVVTVETAIVTDVWIEVTVDGTTVMPGGTATSPNGMAWSFIMPNHDVTVDVKVLSYETDI